MNTGSVHGTVHPRFAAVRNEFARGFAERDELGASLAVMLDGELVVDLWGGWANEERTRPWERDTLVVIHSVTKGFLALSAHILAAKGLLDFDTPVASYWPEFAQRGKTHITVRELMSHQAGLPVVDVGLPADSYLDWEAMVSALAAQSPIWEPGTRHGYHAWTWGWLVGELLRRVTGKMPGDVVRDELTGPWELDFHLGCGPELDARIAELTEPSPGTVAAAGEMTALRQRAEGIAPLNEAESSDPMAWRRAQLPAGNGHATAAAIAGAFGGMAQGGELGGVRLLDEDRIPLLWEEQVAGMDEVQGFPTRYGLGLWLKAGDLAPHRSERSFYHPGAGGALGVGDPEHRLGFGYAMNRQGALFTRRVPLEEAVYACLAG